MTRGLKCPHIRSVGHFECQTLMVLWFLWDGCGSLPGPKSSKISQSNRVALDVSLVVSDDLLLGIMSFPHSAREKTRRHNGPQWTMDHNGCRQVMAGPFRGALRPPGRLYNSTFGRVIPGKSTTGYTSVNQSGNLGLKISLLRCFLTSVLVRHKVHKHQRNARCH